MKLLFVASEAFPLVKTGGLGDVAYSLPCALQAEGVDVRLLLPAYRDLLRKLASVRILGWLEVQGANRVHSVRILQAEHPDYPFPLWLVDCQALFDRPGNPYLQANGYDWADNAERFTVFARVAAELARDALGLGWTPEVVHAHDWQTGLVPAFLEMLPQRPQRVFTIHNLAYGGHFSQADFTALQLPSHWWSAEGVEFYGGFSMLKAGIVYSDAVTTVSPTYAKEICTPAFGYGLDGLLQSRAYKLHGILNGIDMDVWNPATDPALAGWYFTKQAEPGKSVNKRELLKRFGVSNPGSHLQYPLLGMVSRLVEQKGVDLVINAIPGLLADTEARFVLIGAGHGYFEQRLHELAAEYPERVFVFIGYDEQLAHLLEAGADMFLMPSRFEPCGLNQMYSLRYGTPPIVFHTGGLADTVTDASPQNVQSGKANGFVFHEPSSRDFSRTVRRALDCFAQPAVWDALQATGMQQDFGWSNSAAQYLDIYRSHG
ncbi:MAG: glycogen synthase GlgA [Thiothrix sp.]|uniref:glycogen synthase GlgA n=1 Tax=Thiothrix sp. TaxID=1032 RepID=UPI00261BAA83|nr:glycogen synthase GlgA [Thiothrix sp.]MDD5391662.1 glycogen synthase GlgA [Thiothrix sp.]